LRDIPSEKGHIGLQAPMTSQFAADRSEHFFHTTRWTRVCLAKVSSDEGRRALAELCEAYYEPVLTFLRCELRDAEAACEMSHSFFEEMLGGGRIHAADPARGRFRGYLLGAVKHFLARQREMATRMKRGGGRAPVPLDHVEVDTVADIGLSPDAVFDRQWALTVLARGLEALRAECAADGKAEFFERVMPLLNGDVSHGEQAALAEASGMSVPAFRMAVHRLRRRLRNCVKAEVAGTLDDPDLVQEELQALFTALGG
jgi:RNA polymerase sigma-70 factor (ECF subfamily)